MSSNRGNYIPVMQAPPFDYEEIQRDIKCEYSEDTGEILSSGTSNGRFPIQEEPYVTQTPGTIAAGTDENCDVEMMNYHIKSEETLMNDYAFTYGQRNSMFGGMASMDFLQKGHVKTEKDNIIRTMYKCDCGATFCDKFSHFGHMLDHSVRFICNTCGLMFETEEEMQSHIIYNHVVRCKFCGKFISHKDLNRHNVLWHPDMADRERTMYEKRRLERNRQRRQMTDWVHHVSQWRLAIDNLNSYKIPSFRKKAKNKKISEKYPKVLVTPGNVKIEPNANVKIESRYMNVKIEPGAVNVKIEPGSVNVKIEPNHFNIKSEPDW